MSGKCPGCGFYNLACQCRKDDNYCGKIDDYDTHGNGCDRVISDCHCEHNDHYSYDNPNTDKYDNDDTCNGQDSDWKDGDKWIYKA